MSQEKIRVDHMVTQYIWTLENDAAFMTKARYATTQSNLNELRRLVQNYIRPARRLLGED